MLQILYLYNHAKSIWIISYELNASCIIYSVLGFLYYVLCIMFSVLSFLYYLFCIISSIYFHTIEPHV